MDDLFGRGIDHGERAALGGLDPFSVDIEFAAHGFSPGVRRGG